MSDSLIQRLVSQRQKFSLFNTFGFLAPEAVELLNRVQRVMHFNVKSPRSTNIVFKRIGFAIQKGLAAQLVACLPSIDMY
ncbi:unnamed protein product [Lactuca virosa]|uniref:Uncharacterized protein n=1 Tax=Lactuca virosa TaxID=75947 RepID=A0AAU9LH09_9ASTR|nr:unnamed protein product [Lactuca virosa]